MLQILCISLVIIIMTIIITWLDKRIEKQLFRKVLLTLFIIYLCGNLYFTIFSRDVGNGVFVDLMPFHSYSRLFIKPIRGTTAVSGLAAVMLKGTRPIIGLILNILLYYPLGYLLPILFPKLKPMHVILIGCLCSIATEAAQYLLKMGWCETDDVIHNTLGTAIGVWVWHLQSKRLNKPKSNELPKD